MKNIYLLILVIILIFCTGFSDSTVNIAVSYQPEVDKLEHIFRASLPLKDGVIYTKVPRGLIVSINENYFFDYGEAKIKQSSLCILDTIAALLHKLSNYCVIENHTLAESVNNNDVDANWELSLMRAENIVEYLTVYAKLPASQLFSLGYGQYMPFRDNVGRDKKGMDNRIDFVILEYEAKR